MTARRLLLALLAVAIAACHRAGPMVPRLEYRWTTACGNALAVASNGRTEALWADIDVKKLALIPGQAKVVTLPDDTVKVSVDVGRYVGPLCGDVYSGTPEYTTWRATEGRVTIMSARTPGDWIMAQVLYFVSVEIRDLVISGPAGVIVRAQKDILLMGLAGEGPGP